MAYVALATAAIGGKSWLLATAVALASILAFCYAVFVGTAWDERRGLAGGFILLFAVYAWAVFFMPRSVPSSRVLEACGYTVSNNGAVLVTDASSFGFSAGPSQSIVRPALELIPMVRTANAAGAMAAGLVGCMLGALVFRPARRANARGAMAPPRARQGATDGWAD